VLWESIVATRRRSGSCAGRATVDMTGDSNRLILDLYVKAASRKLWPMTAVSQHSRQRRSKKRGRGLVAVIAGSCLGG